MKQTAHSAASTSASVSAANVDFTVQRIFQDIQTRAQCIFPLFKNIMYLDT